MERQFSNIILLDNAQQYNDLLDGKSVTLASGTVLTEIDPNAEYKVPASMFTRYHIKIVYSISSGVTESIEFDIYSTNPALFSTSNTASANWAIFQALYANEKMVVAYHGYNDQNYDVIGSAVLTVPATSTADVDVEGGGFDRNAYIPYYIMSKFLPSQITSFTF